MIFVECPYCNKDINILFGQEILKVKGFQIVNVIIVKKFLKFIWEKKKLRQELNNYSNKYRV